MPKLSHAHTSPNRLSRSGWPATIAFSVLSAAMAWGQTDIARGKPATASSVQKEGDPAQFKPDFAFDGNPNTRWGSDYKDSQWVYVDLKERFRIEKAILKWEDANAKTYRLDVSDDAVKWDTLIRVMNRPIGERTDTVTIAEPKSGRYVRMFGEVRNQSKLYLPLVEYNGLSLWNFQIYGSPATTTLGSLNGGALGASGTGRPESRIIALSYSGSAISTWPYVLPHKSMVRLDIYTLNGSGRFLSIETLQNAGRYPGVWSPESVSTRRFAPGLFLARLTIRTVEGENRE